MLYREGLIFPFCYCYCKAVYPSLLKCVQYYTENPFAHIRSVGSAGFESRRTAASAAKLASGGWGGEGGWRKLRYFLNQTNCSIFKIQWCKRVLLLSVIISFYFQLFAKFCEMARLFAFICGYSGLSGTRLCLSWVLANWAVSRTSRSQAECCLGQRRVTLNTVLEF